VAAPSPAVIDTRFALKRLRLPAYHSHGEYLAVISAAALGIGLSSVVSNGRGETPRWRAIAADR
jgi:hypothetical protein